MSDPPLPIKSFGNRPTILWVIILVGFICLLFIGNLDPFLHEWDERFHALVASHMMNDPFRPTLYTNPIFSYKIEDWCCNHIWLHKQPLFLWFMSISMKFFGTTIFALRLPSILLSSILPLFVFDIAHRWTANRRFACIAASFMAFSFYSILLSSGTFHTDHNDAQFCVFVTGNIWAWIRYVDRPTTKRAILIGLFCGLAILIKWLVALLIFGVWFVIKFNKLWNQRSQRMDFIWSILTCVIIALPWQIYSAIRFPAEWKRAMDHNALHISTVLDGHSGGPIFYLSSSTLYYGALFFLVVPLMIWFVWKEKKKPAMQWGLILSMAVVYLFSPLSRKRKC